MISILTDSPSLTIQPNNATVVEGNTFKLQCGGISLPIFDVKWYKNNQLLNVLSSVYDDIGDNNRTASLIITSANVTDIGYYHCVIANTLGSDISSTAWIDILCKYLRFNFLLKTNLTALSQQN